MPFRSDTESLREQIRRIDEQAAELVEERNLLEGQLAKQNEAGGGLRAKLLLFAALAAVSAVTLVGFVAGDLEADRRARNARDVSEQRQREELRGVARAARECGLLESARESDLVLCERQQPQQQQRDPLAPGRGGLR